MGLDSSVYADLGHLLQLEWLETNGLGDYAAATVSGINTRRHHGLFVAGPPGTERCRLLCAKLDESVFIDGQRYELAANEYQGAFHPQGYRFLVDFQPWPWPIWTYDVEGVRIEKQVLMPHGQRATLVGYRVLNHDAPVGLELRPLLAGRDCHSLMIENWQFRRQVSSHDRRLELTPYDAASRIVLAHPQATFGGDGFWFYNFLYRGDEGRQPNDLEDLFSPGAIVSTLRPKATLWTVVSPAPLPDLDPAAAAAAELYRREDLRAKSEEPLRQRLLTAADAFRIQTPDGPAFVAGYPWRGPRLRDSLQALPGLTIHAGLPRLAREVLAAIGDELRQPQHPRDVDSYTVDGPLWYAWAARSYLDATGDDGFGEQSVAPALMAWLGRLEAGPLPGIWIEPDGLLAQGLPDRALTWMDAAGNGGPSTPRRGKAVELNALWHAALALIERLGGVPSAGSAEVGEAFLARFWDAGRGYLLDVADGPDGDDDACRPNQLWAVTCDPTLLPDEVAAQVVEAVTTRLLTPFGLRTLAPGHWAYCGTDAPGAAHQGAVWPWLLGTYAEALRRVAPDADARLEDLLATVAGELDTGCLGQLAERREGEPPHAPHGCFADALAVAELLRLTA